MASVAVGVAGPDEMHCGTPRCPTSTDGYMGKMDRAETPPGQLDLTCPVSPLNIETIVGPTRARRPQRVTPPSPRWTMGWSPHRHTLQLDYPIKYTTTHQPLTLLTAATCPPPIDFLRPLFGKITPAFLLSSLGQRGPAPGGPRHSASEGFSEDGATRVVGVKVTPD